MNILTGMVLTTLTVLLQKMLQQQKNLCSMWIPPEFTRTAPPVLQTDTGTDLVQRSVSVPVNFMPEDRLAWKAYALINTNYLATEISWLIMPKEERVFILKILYKNKQDKRDALHRAMHPFLLLS